MPTYPASIPRNPNCRVPAEVHALLHESAKGKMISEWAKKPECWEIIKSGQYSDFDSGIPEFRWATTVVKPGA
jgi:hypothetical protein